uniref:Uncharacterized protein n=1 Tax=Tetraselmis sp. GSL018 TaxID=582737 RepID=A0A061S9I5_9CHLO
MGDSENCSLSNIIEVDARRDSSWALAPEWLLFEVACRVHVSFGQTMRLVCEHWSKALASKFLTTSATAPENTIPRLACQHPHVQSLVICSSGTVRVCL